MTIRKKPNWISVTGLSSSYEEELDVNARPDAPREAMWRHRPISYTGEEVERWRAGPAPKDGE